MAGKHEALPKPRPAWRQMAVAGLMAMAAQMAGDALLAWIQSWPWQ